MLNKIMDSKFYRLIDSKKFSQFMMSLTSTFLIIGLVIISNAINKTGNYLAKETQENVVYVHDTLIVQMPEKQYCFKCNSELVGILDHSVTCCGFKFTYEKNTNSLFAKLERQ